MNWDHEKKKFGVITRPSTYIGSNIITVNFLEAYIAALDQSAHCTTINGNESIMENQDFSDHYSIHTVLSKRNSVKVNKNCSQEKNSYFSLPFPFVMVFNTFSIYEKV